MSRKKIRVGKGKLNYTHRQTGHIHNQNGEARRPVLVYRDIPMEAWSDSFGSIGLLVLLDHVSPHCWMENSLHEEGRMDFNIEGLDVSQIERLTVEGLKRLGRSPSQGWGALTQYMAPLVGEAKCLTIAFRPIGNMVILTETWPPPSPPGTNKVAEQIEVHF